MSDTPPTFDLKFLPDWLKEGTADNRYADFEGEREGRDTRGSFRGDRGDRGASPRGDRRGPPPGRPGDRPAPRGDRPGGPPRRDGGGAPRPSRPGDRGPAPSGDRRDGPPRQGDRRGPDDRQDRGREEYFRPEPLPHPVRVEFLPEPHAANGIGRQIKQNTRAYPLFATGRLFLESPERHRVRFTSLDNTVPLFQIGEGPVAFDRTLLERNAFRNSRADYYKEEVVQSEPLKGNFANVARARLTGALLGPTNYHGYQPALRKLYEERYARRMSFAEFSSREIEVVTDEATVAAWKEQARTTTTYVTTQEAEPVTFPTEAAAEQHFRAHYLPQLLKTGSTLECSGNASRVMPERPLGDAVRVGWEKERGFPAQLVNYLRPYLMEAGLHFFKHRKRVLFISAARPVRHQAGQVFSAGVSGILSFVETHPRCSRRDLAVQMLGGNPDDPEQAEAKSSLARDLHYLLHAGHVVEFSDATLDLPLAAGPPAAQQPANKYPKYPGSGQAPAAEQQSLVEETITEETPEGISGGEAPSQTEQPGPVGDLSGAVERSIESAPVVLDSLADAAQSEPLRNTEFTIALGGSDFGIATTTIAAPEGVSFEEAAAPENVVSPAPEAAYAAEAFASPGDLSGEPLSSSTGILDLERDCLPTGEAPLITEVAKAEPPIDRPEDRAS